MMNEAAILELLKLAIVGLVSGFFSYYLSGRKHRTEKWWELRVAAYQEAISALSDLCYYFKRHLTFEETGRELTEERKKELQRFWDDGYHKVRKAADAGAFLFSADAETALKTFINDENEHYNTYYEYLDGRCVDAKKCLDELVACSKNDLLLKDGFFKKRLKMS
jgi:hypothetical protein